MKDQLIKNSTWNLALALGFSNIKSVPKQTYKQYVDARGNPTEDDYLEWGYITEETKPTQSHLAYWFRDNHNIFISPEPSGSWRYSIRYRYMDKTGQHFVGYIRSKGEIEFFNSYEDALEEGLVRSLEYIKDN